MTLQKQEPAVVRHARTFYAALDALAQDEVITTEGAEIKKCTTLVRVFRGSLTEAYHSTGAAQSHIGNVRALLIHYDCIDYVQRGNRGQESVLVLNHPLPFPLPALSATSSISANENSASANSDENSATPHTNILQSGARKDLRSADDAAILRRKVEALTAWRESLPLNLTEALQNIEKRLRRLESEAK